MVHIDKDTGSLIIEIKKEQYWSAAEELQMRREALYDMIIEHNTEQFFSNDTFYGIVKIIKNK